MDCGVQHCPQHWHVGGLTTALTMNALDQHTVTLLVQSAGPASFKHYREPPDDDTMLLCCLVHMQLAACLGVVAGNAPKWHHRVTQDAAVQPV